MGKLYWTDPHVEGKRGIDGRQIIDQKQFLQKMVVFIESGRSE